jgi:hypothetical protein
VIPGEAAEGMKIVEFLEARIAEDERAAYDLMGEREGDRTLAECAAKRAIVADYSNAVADEPWRSQDAIKTYAMFAAAWTFTLRHLASVYKDHPDYQQEWATR